MRTSRSKEPAKPPHSPTHNSRGGSKTAERPKLSPAPGQKPKKKVSRTVPKPDTQVQALLKELLAQSASTDQNVKALAGMLQAFMASVSAAIPNMQTSGIGLEQGSWQQGVTVLRVESVGTQTSRKRKDESEESEEGSEEESQEEGEEGEEEDEGEDEGEEEESEGDEEEQDEEEGEEEEKQEEESSEDDPPLKSPQIRLLPPDSPSLPAAKRKKGKRKAHK